MFHPAENSVCSRAGSLLPDQSKRLFDLFNARAVLGAFAKERSSAPNFRNAPRAVASNAPRAVAWQFGRRLGCPMGLFWVRVESCGPSLPRISMFNETWPSEGSLSIVFFLTVTYRVVPLSVFYSNRLSFALQHRLPRSASTQRASRIPVYAGTCAHFLDENRFCWVAFTLVPGESFMVTATRTLIRISSVAVLQKAGT